jgi:ammonium transporter, Amt family
MISAWIYMGASKIKFKLDDPVDAVAVHFANGAFRDFAVGFFARGKLVERAGYQPGFEGIFNGGIGTLLLSQVAEIAFVVGWVGVLMTPFFYVLNAVGQFRIDALEEEIGLDIFHHRGAAYDFGGPTKETVDEFMKVCRSGHGSAVSRIVEAERSVVAEDASNEAEA